MYIAVLEKDCTPHYFIEEKNAQKYLIDNSPEINCNLDVSQLQHAAELYNSEGISIGYYFQPKIEDISQEEKSKRKILTEEKIIE